MGYMQYIKELFLRKGSAERVARDVPLIFFTIICIDIIEHTMIPGETIISFSYILPLIFKGIAAVVVLSTLLLIYALIVLLVNKN